MGSKTRFLLAFLLVMNSALSQAEFCGPGTHWDDLQQLCIVTNGSDSNFDGCIFLEDLLALLSGFGTCEAIPTSYDCSYVLYDDHWYETVEIGNQIWFAENLRNTHYANGDPIPEFLNSLYEPSGATFVFGDGGGYCNNEGTDYDFTCDESFALAQYGRLYNGYAVADARGLCPNGWHIPTSAEWSELYYFLVSQGLEYTGAIALRATSGWPEGSNGTDDFGFSALPGGLRFDTGNYWYAGIGGSWWSSTSSVTSGTNNLELVAAQISDDPDWFPTDWNAEAAVGLSVRCIAD